MDIPQIKFKIENFRAIKIADIIINGITVVAGENGSGKSTISKLLYHLFKISIDYDETVERKLLLKLKNIAEVNYLLSEEFVREKGIKISDKLIIEELKRTRELMRPSMTNLHKYLFAYDKPTLIFDDIKKVLLNNMNRLINSISIIQEDILNKAQRVRWILSDFFLDEDGEVSEEASVIELLNKLKEKIQNILNQTEKIKEARPLEILSKSLLEAFNGNPPNIENYNLEEYGTQIIDTKKSRLTPVLTIKNVAYIDTPMIVDMNVSEEQPYWKDLHILLKKKTKYDDPTEIDEIFKDVIKGEISYTGDDVFARKNFTYKREDGGVFDLMECATGLKSFAILQLLYKTGALNKNSLIIIDEPEVHLHPQWVVEYARLLVLLHKKVGVRFFIASHHPRMVSAIKYIAEKEEIDKNLNFYLAENNKGKDFSYEYKHLGTDIEDIFDSFNVAFDKMDDYGNTE